MENFSFTEIAQQLDTIENVEEESGVSFLGQSKAWHSESVVQDVIDEINKCEKLIYLNLEGNTLGVDAAIAIGKALEKHPEFKKALWKDLFTGRLKTEIPLALKEMGNGIISAGANLTVLDCSDNALGPNGMVGLVDFIRSSACYSLQELKLNNCGLGIEGGRMLSEALLDCHKSSIKANKPLQLKVFITGRNRLENQGAKYLAKFFMAVKSLEEVAMPQNGINHAGITALSLAFKENPDMKILNLNDNTVMSEGAESLADAFKSMEKLKDINFGDCLLKTEGALLLADALQDGHTDLEVLDLGYNEIDVDGGVAVASAMANKNNLLKVILDGNIFDKDECDVIKDTMMDNGNSHALSLLNLENEDDDEDDESENGHGEEEIDEDEDDEDASTEANFDSAVKDDDEEDVNYVSVLANKTLNSTVEASFSSQGDGSSSVLFVNEDSLPNTIETFINTNNASLKMFTALEETDKLEAFRNCLKNFTEDEYLIKLTFLILKCSALSEDSTDALRITESLYKDAFDYAVATNQITRVRTFFLIQLGLLKCEDKHFRPSYNLKACRYAMKKSIENKSFPDDIEATFKLFLDKFA